MFVETVYVSSGVNPTTLQKFHHHSSLNAWHGTLNTTVSSFMIHLLAIAGYVQTHVHSIIIALLVSYAIGFAWHGPVFGKLWMSYNKMTAPKKEDMKFSMMLPGLGANLVLVVVQSAVLGRTFQIVSLANIGQALLIATVLWLPFTGLTIINSYAWEGKKIGHMCLDAGYYLVSIWATAAVLYSTL
jgi:hypothetical protein